MLNSAHKGYEYQDLLSAYFVAQYIASNKLDVEFLFDSKDFDGDKFDDLKIYDDRVEISSPGTLYGTLTLEEALSGRSSIRNKTLARTLEKVHVLEGWGSGFQRINTMCQEYGVDFPEFTEIGDMFRVNFYRRQNSGIGDKSAINSKIGDKFQRKDCQIPCCTR